MADNANDSLPAAKRAKPAATVTASATATTTTPYPSLPSSSTSKTLLSLENSSSSSSSSSSTGDRPPCDISERVREMLRDRPVPVGESDVLRRVKAFLPAMAAADAAMRSAASKGDEAEAEAGMGASVDLNIEKLTDESSYIEMVRSC